LAADWLAAGVPAGVTPAVGVAFVATGVGTGSGTCASPLASGIYSPEVLGDPNTTINNVTTPYIIVQTMGATSSATTTPIPVTPANGSVMGFGFFFKNSSVAVGNE
jgi:hypothetical protein